ncbi:hypothetical protein [Vibrio tapetis]|uniref:Uncharacterized protein n=1 Tax=Vibrio tapetis subsp. tapetis TaxID=1671868 RepID=A0A2N8ZEW1_9VIBR|nr:hypothetical protein [Vibrio tapetis]SON50418.1 conserved protein of unknown function [Vibrio tapetis subsp. tapetis]
MLKAILHGKAGRIEHGGQDSVRWASVFKAREDLLTSTFFERFAYLSDDVQTQILASCFSLSPDDFQVKFGAFQSIDYWPRYELGEGRESRQVEPDLVIRFDKCNLIVEVIKPPAGGDQYYDQWQREVDSFLQSDEHKALPLHFLAIGRIDRHNAQQWAYQLKKPNSVLELVGAIKWQAVTDKLIQQLASEGANKTDRRVLTDMLEGLALYGLKTNNFKWCDLVNHGFECLTLDHSRLVDSKLDQELIPANLSQSNQKLIHHNFNPVSLDALSVWPRNTHE